MNYRNISFDDVPLDIQKLLITMILTHQPLYADILMLVSKTWRETVLNHFDSKFRAKSINPMVV